MKNATIHAIPISSISNSLNLRLDVNYSLRAIDTTLSSEAGNSADSVSDDEISLLDSIPLEDPWSAQVPNWLSVTSLWKIVTVHVNTTKISYLISLSENGQLVGWLLRSKLTICFIWIFENNEFERLKIIHISIFCTRGFFCYKFSHFQTFLSCS